MNAIIIIITIIIIVMCDTDIWYVQESSPAGSSDDGWTMLNEGDTATDGEAAASSESVPRDGIYPSKQNFFFLT